MALLTLTKKPEAYQFSIGEEHELRSMLEESDRHTTIMPIGSPAEVLLNPDTGLTASGYSYTDVSFGQLCAALSPGLALLATDLSGQWRRQREDKQFFSGEAAVETFNRVLRLRFGRRLMEMQLVRDTKHKLIDGLVGGRYRYLSNNDFFERVSSRYDKTTIRFSEAYLYGRQLCVRYVFTNTDLSYEIGGELYSPGFHFANSEIGGRSVRAASVLRHPSGFYAISSYRDYHGGRVIHSGAAFERRLEGLLSAVVNWLPPRNDMASHGLELKKQSLNFGGQADEKHVKHLTSVLRRKKLTLSFAKRVIASVAKFGDGTYPINEDMLPEEKKAVLVLRNGYDFFVAITREARDLPLNLRETAEQVAYGVLTGNIRL